MSSYIENKIARRLIRNLLAQGFKLGVNDGEDDVQMPSRDSGVIWAAMRTTEEDYLIVWTPEGSFRGWVRLIYDNGVDLISDYTTNLEGELAATTAWVEALEGGDDYEEEATVRDALELALAYIQELSVWDEIPRQNVLEKIRAALNWPSSTP
jgi:hypothetical protein